MGLLAAGLIVMGVATVAKAGADLYSAHQATEANKYMVDQQTGAEKDIAITETENELDMLKEELALDREEMANEDKYGDYTSVWDSNDRAFNYDYDYGNREAYS